MFEDGGSSFGIRKSSAALAIGLLVAIFIGIGIGQAGCEARLPDPPKKTTADPIRLKCPELETDAAFAGTWQLVEGGGDGAQKVGDRMVVEETALDFGPDKGRSVWSWHQTGPPPRVMTHWTPYVNWAPERTPAEPWPIIDLRRGSSLSRGRERAIYHLRGDVLLLAFHTKDGRLPIDFATGPGHDVEMWRRVAPPVTRLEPESFLDGQWRLAKVTFHASGTFGAAANAKVPDHLAGTKGPRWFLKEGTIFEVKDGAWREEGRGEVGLSWTSKRELKLPRRVYTRRMPDPRPAGVPAEDVGTYGVGLGELTLTFHQQWLAPNVKGDIYLYTGQRIETYERPGSRPDAREQF